MRPALTRHRSRLPPTARSRSCSMRRSGWALWRSQIAKTIGSTMPAPPMRAFAGLFGPGDGIDDRGEAAGGERGAAEVESAPARPLGVGRHDLAGGEVWRSA